MAMITSETPTTCGVPTVTRAVREVVEAARQTVLAGGIAEVTDAGVCARAQELARGSLRRVLNATGIVVHTNLGRAPLAAGTIRSLTDVGANYNTLEYSLSDGTRGSRGA